MDRPTRPTQLIPAVRLDADTHVIDEAELSDLKAEQPSKPPGVKKWWFTIALGVILMGWSVVALLTAGAEPTSPPDVVNAPTTSAFTPTPTPTNSPTAVSAAPTPTPSAVTVTETRTVAGPTVYVTTVQTVTATATVVETVTATATVTETITATPPPPTTEPPSE